MLADKGKEGVARSKDCSSSVVLQELFPALKLFYLYSWRKRKVDTIEHREEIGISVVKTIAGISQKAFENLESLFTLNYSKFELLICVHDKENDIILGIQKLIQKYPDVDVHVFQGACDVGINPKINNIMQCYEQIKYQYVWICDSNILVQASSLTELASHIQQNVGMIHQLPFKQKSSTDNFGDCLDKVYFGTQHARWYLFFDALGLCCTNGMSSIFDKKALDELGGLSAFSNYIAEDHFMGKSFYERNYKLVLSTEPVLQNPDACTASIFVKRMTRWQKLRLTMLPVGILEPLIECFLLGVVASFSSSFLFGTSIVGFYVKHVSCWFLSDQILLWLVQGDYQDLPPLWLRTAAWFFRELVTYWVYLQALWDRKIHWRMGTFDLKFGGHANLIRKTDVKHA